MDKDEVRLEVFARSSGKGLTSSQIDSIVANCDDIPCIEGMINKFYIENYLDYDEKYQEPELK